MWSKDTSLALLSVDDEDLRANIMVRPRSQHKRAGVQMMEAVHRKPGRRRWQRVYKIVMLRMTGERRIPKGLHIDHIDGNPMNNRRDNLRLATPMQNAANRVGGTGTSPYKGVYRLKNFWRAQLNLTARKGKSIRLDLGRFDDEGSAAMAYNEAALEWYGCFSRLNSFLEASTDGTH